ncbi:condensation domain-containing protein [Streptomyces sp. SID13031]|uniref:condensation domain-containing protein n=1 Tax=Streptomyces sp. SID13031 TaxID=2706046 RepID=UPI001EF3C38F|nr:condensation domain-containing protein [Streptomyces sp. SID13031]
MAWRLTGASIDLAALHAALFDIVERHEALRTRIAEVDGSRYQEILAAGPVRLDLRDFASEPGSSRADRAEALVAEIETETMSPTVSPFLRAVLARFDDSDAVLVLMAHHLATDGISLGVMIRDLANCYAIRIGRGTPTLPVAPQYRDYCDWEREHAGPASRVAREYWRRQLDGARFTAIPTDFPRSAGLPESTAKHHFLLPGDVVSAIDGLARKSRATRFMVFAAAYQLLVHRLTGTTDLVTAIFTPGRGDRRFEESVGSFFNFVPLRTNLAGCATYEDVLTRTRRACLDAYSYDIPTVQIFAEAPQLMEPAMADNGTAAVFESVPDQNPITLAPDGLTFTRITRLLRSQSLCSAVPDGALWDVNKDPSGDGIGTVAYKRNLFSDDTVASMAADFGQIARDFSASPDASAGLL